MLALALDVSGAPLGLLSAMSNNPVLTPTCLLGYYALHGITELDGFWKESVDGV